jgi:hypothetical protein
MSPGTFVFRPPFARILKKPNTLWHTLKPSGNYFNHCPGKEEDNLYGWAKFISKFFLYRILITLWFWFIWRPATTSIPSNPKRLEAQAAAKE